jgi:ubiquinone/menaquinone biosynthesis C-methylase UbiE
MHTDLSAARSAGGYIVDTPYPETFFRELSPAWLNYVAALGGVRARPLDEPFTYLELGCGRGSSVITNAGAFPQGRFHACDINHTHVRQARARAAAFSIRNVEFLECGFEQLRNAAPPMFDFIVAHGVYSWVAPQERQAICELVRDFLKPGGLLYLSYNSLPGWAGEMPLRKLIVELAQDDTGDSMTRAAHALASLQSLAAQRLRFLETNPAAAAAIRAYADAPISYLVHEFLNETWQPFYCVDVADQLREAGVLYLGSATLAENHPQLIVDESTLQSLEQLTTHRQRRLALDFATHQQFRRDVFRREPARRDQAALDSMIVGCSGDPELVQTDVRVPRGVIHFRDTFIRRLRELLQSGPITISAAVAALAGNAREAEESRRNLQYLVAAGALLPFARTDGVACAEGPVAPAEGWVASVEGCRPANAIVRQVLQYSIDHNVECVVPSELLGNGARVAPTEAAAVLGWLSGDRAPAARAVVARLLRVGILR